MDGEAANVAIRAASQASGPRASWSNGARAGEWRDEAITRVPLGDYGREPLQAEAPFRGSRSALDDPVGAATAMRSLRRRTTFGVAASQGQPTGQKRPLRTVGGEHFFPTRSPGGTHPHRV